MNPKIIAFIGTVVFNIAAIFALVQQYKEIPKKKGEAVSNKFFITVTMLFAMTLIYSLIGKREGVDYGVLTSSVMMLPINIMIMKRLWREKGYTLTDKITWLVFTLPILIMFELNAEKRELVLFYMFAARSLFILDQPWQILKNRSRGTVRIAWIPIFAAANVCWAFYFHWGHQYWLKKMSIYYVVVFVLTALIWWITPILFRNRQR